MTALGGLIIAFVSMAIVLFWPAMIICAIVLLVKHFNKKHDESYYGRYDAEVKSGIQRNSAKQAAPPKPKNPYAGINAMLLTGSALLVVAIVRFTHEANDSLVAPVAIALTLLFYVLGYFIYKKIDYLKIVGTAFSYISLAIFPFWVISFNFFGMSWHGAWILSSIITLGALLLTSYLYKSKIPAYVAYPWLLVVAWACRPDITPSGELNFTIYWSYAASAVVALIPAIIWKLKPNWVPAYFRRATRFYAMLLMPAVALFSVWLYSYPNTMAFFPFLRTVMICAFLAWILVHWSISQSYDLFVFSRFVAQAVLLTVVMDSLNYSLVASSFQSLSDAAQLGMITVWLLSFLGQAMLSLFLPKKDKTTEQIERYAEVISLIGILATPLLTHGLQDPVGATVRLIICLVVAILGICYTTVHKNPDWSIASIVALFLGRLAIVDSVLANGWNSWSDVVYFTIVAGVVLALYAAFRKYGEKESFPITTVGLILCLLIIIYSSIQAEYAEVGWLITALYLALFGYMSKHKVLYELSIYSGAFCLYCLVGTIGDSVLPESAQKCIQGPTSLVTPCRGQEAATYTNWIAGINVIRCFIIGGALTALSLLKERGLEQAKRWRFYLAYFLMGLGLYAVGASAGEYWMLFCLALQVGYLIYAALNDVEWLVWLTIIAMPICALSLTGGFTYVWFAILGLTLIGVVVWRLSRMNHARIAAEMNKQQTPPANTDK